MRALLAAIIALFCAVASAQEMAAAPSSASFFALSMSTVDDKPVALASFKGKPLIVNFWARWCGPCRKEIPDLAEMREKYKARGLVVLGIGVEDASNRDSVSEFAKAYEMNYTLLIGGVQKSIELMKASGNPKSGLPFTVVIDRNGRIVATKLGAMNKAEMETAIGQIL